METKSRREERIARQNWRSLLSSFALAAFVLLLVVLFGVGRAYADEQPNMPIPPDPIDDPPAYTIEGFVYYDGYIDPPVPGVWVRLYGASVPPTMTDSRGYFKFESIYYISPNMGYVITVNGDQQSLGVSADDPQWGQWAGWVYTNQYAYAYKAIQISRSAEVNVPAAALFSNTQYATLRYGAESTSTFSHTVNFNVAVAEINTGYTTSLSVSYGFEVAPTYASYWRRPYYAATYYSEGYMNRWGIVSTGIAGENPKWLWGSAPTQEYVDPNTLTQGYFNFPCARGTLEWYHYKETGSYTWSYSTGVGFAINYQAFGISIGVDTTVTTTSGTESWVYFEVDRRSESSPDIRLFRAYSPGWPLNPNKNPSQGIGGMELHIWEIGVG